MSAADKRLKWGMGDKANMYGKCLSGPICAQIHQILHFVEKAAAKDTLRVYLLLRSVSNERVRV